MAERNLNARIVHKHDTEANWINAVNFIPKQGEIIVYDVDEQYNYPRFKVGDGITAAPLLPFVDDGVKELIEACLADSKLYTDEKTAASASAILYTPQDLTDEQKAQARKNLGLTGNEGGGSETTPPDGSSPVTTEYVYTYDGDTNSEEHGWVTNYGGIKVFAKMGEVPEGTLNLVGSTIFRTNPSNQWLDRTFTITDEHLTKVLNKSETDIPATQEGLIQIYDMIASDFSEFTVLCICTKAGWYNVCFDDWYEIINFPETGIYAYDKRTYGGNDYLQSFTFTVTSTPSSGNDDVNDNINTAIPTKYKGNEIQMFSRGICIGDSVTEGSVDNDDGGAIVKRFAYPAVLERITGIEIANAGIAGATSKTWYEASLNSDEQWGKWVNDEWVWNMNPNVASTDVVSSSLDYSNFDFAIIHLGINDFGLMAETDTIETMLVTFETYINTIINNLKTHSNGIKIFLATIVPSYAPASHMGFVTMNQKIREMAAATDDVYLLDLNAYSELAAKGEYNVIHPTALGYQKLASEIASYISYIIGNNLNEFKEVQFIAHTDKVVEPSGSTTITGTPGQFVVIGEDGKPVAQTIVFNVYYNGTSDPDNAIGQDGDLYLVKG